ncbi:MULTISPECIES: fused MFS/spermidine synthase [Ramlibacter]|uniref:Spermidine synthase n=1 Tax=Ramlibacter pinisoli TaxID=2682844 RepID=A0A6N8IVQ1_9BURK|nr:MULTISPECIES: fused MFS/spermidine synthase [Ramlibacter]MBA2960951.1 fused MFS/spermidine synthase [Ramlibacter sp. CGMCC 1.13660]MVQ30897.1 spermidine synthase [Ramlibacter pinisoli]
MAIDITETDGLRLLRLGGTPWCQGAMRLDAPDQLELEYAVRMFGWLLFHDPGRLAGKHLVTLGLGAGSLTRFAHRVLGMQSTAVEIDAQVIDACRTHFQLPPDGHGLHVVHADAREFIAQARHQRSIDVLLVDAYDATVDKPVLDTEAFHADCRGRLREGGTVAINLVGDALDLRGSVARIRTGLRPTTVWQFPPTAAGNVVVIAHCGDMPADDLLAARAATIEQRWGLPAPAWLAMARRTPGPVQPTR